MEAKICKGRIKANPISPFMRPLYTATIFRMEPLCRLPTYSPQLHRSDSEKSVIETIRRLIDEKGNLATPARDLALGADLFRVGLTPFTAIQLMLALEKEFGVEFPKQMLNRRCMSSINAIRSCICELQELQAASNAA